MTGAAAHDPEREDEVQADPGPEGVELEEQLGAAERERDEYRDSLQRLKADFDNYRKRAARDQASFATRAAESLVKELLPILDDLERALDAAEHHEEAKLEEGV